MNLKEMLYNDDGTKKIVRFTHYFDGNLWYETQDFFAFPVPLDDVGNATFRAEDHAPLFMRYIRKHLQTLKDAKLNSE